MSSEIKDLLSKAVRENAEIAGKPKISLPPIQKAGFKLAQMVLYIIGGYILFVIIIFVVFAINLIPANSIVDNFDIINAQRESYLNSIFKMSQLVLLNLLLPILTAILGYIFGTNESK